MVRSLAGLGGGSGRNVLVDILKSLEGDKRVVVPEFATTKPAIVHEYREIPESDRAWHIEQTLQKRILKEIWRCA